MDSVFSFVVGLLTAALSLLGFVQQHPELPQASKDQAQQIAQQAITQATQALNNFASACPQLTRDLGPGDTDATTNGEVSLLQKFLIEHHYNSAQGVTGTFDEGATKTNLVRFQKDNGLQGLGVVGPKTRAVIQAKCRTAISNQQTPEVTANPTSGPSPLTVTFRFKNLEENGSYLLDTGNEGGSQFWIKNNMPCVSGASATFCSQEITLVFVAGSGPYGGNTFKVRLFKYDEAKKSYATEVAIGNITISSSGSNGATPTIGTITPIRADTNTLITVKGSNFTTKGAPTIEFLKRMSDNTPFASFRVGDKYGDYISPDGIVLQFIPAAHEEVAHIPAGGYEIRYSNNGVVSGPQYFALSGPQPNTPSINDVSVNEGIDGWYIVVFGNGFTKASTISLVIGGHTTLLQQSNGANTDGYQISASLPANVCMATGSYCAGGTVQVSNGNSVSNTVQIVDTRG